MSRYKNVFKSENVHYTTNTLIVHYNTDKVHVQIAPGYTCSDKSNNKVE